MTLLPNTSSDGTDLSNWLSAEHNFWSYRHVNEIVPCDVVAAPAYARALQETGARDFSEFTFTAHNGQRNVSEFLDSSRTDSFLVAYGDDIVYRWHADGVLPDDKHLIFSVTKSITALLVGALVGKGLIDTEQHITHYIPQVRGSGFEGATVRNLLDMTASYSFVEDYTPGPDILAYRYAAGWYPAPTDAPTLREFIASRGVDGEHGQKFRYLSPTTDLLGWLCEEVSGLSYSDALSTYVWKPLGMRADALMTVDRAGSPRAAGGLSCVPDDLLRLGMAVRDGAHDVIPDAFISDIFTGGSHEHWADGDFATLFKQSVYRSCWYRPGEDPDVLMGIGIYGQMLYIDRPRNVVIAKQSSWALPDETEDHLDAFTLCREIARTFA